MMDYFSIQKKSNIRFPDNYVRRAPPPGVTGEAEYAPVKMTAFGETEDQTAISPESRTVTTWATPFSSATTASIRASGKPPGPSDIPRYGTNPAYVNNEPLGCRRYDIIHSLTPSEITLNRNKSLCLSASKL